nr:DUF4157 domain-containing protein [uncultured Fluviicola sp.]
MNALVAKGNETVSQTDSQNKEGGTASHQHVDNRPEVGRQHKMQQSVLNSENSKQLKACQSMADCSPVGESVKQLKEKANNTGLPNQLKSGVESLSGMSMDHVKVHYNSSKPAQMQAHAYAQGTDIHVASGQEKHLPHEAWHVVQQAQGRVKPTVQLEGTSINDDAGLEKEADLMGAKSLGITSSDDKTAQLKEISGVSGLQPIQYFAYARGTTRKINVVGNNGTNTFEECTKNTVSYNKGEKKRDGTITGDSDWAGWIVNQANTGRNATQLHVVNKRWGGLGGAKDGNIVPGSPAANSHHLHEAEKEFDKCFDGKDEAKENCSYECIATPSYGPGDIDVKGGVQNYDDPTINVTVTDNGVSTPYNPSLGGGVQFKDGS